MLITLEPHGIFGSKFVQLFILTLSAKGDDQFNRSRYFSENAQNSRTEWDILIKFCILIHFKGKHCFPRETHLCNSGY